MPPEANTADDRSAKAPVQVLLIGGARLSRAGLRMLLEAQPGIRIVGEGATPDDGTADADGMEPDVVLLDIDNIDAPEAVQDALRQIQQEAAGARVLILATTCDPEASRRLVLAGGSGIVLKDKTTEHLVRAIRKVHEGELWVDRATTASLISGLGSNRGQKSADPEIAKIESLTRREREVVILIAAGLNNKSIAARLNISDNTVRHHLTSIFEKLDTNDRMELLVYALRHKLAPMPP